MYVHKVFFKKIILITFGTDFVCTQIYGKWFG